MTGSGKAEFVIDGYQVTIEATSTAGDGGYAPDDAAWRAIAVRLWQLVNKTTDKPVTPPGTVLAEPGPGGSIRRNHQPRIGARRVDADRVHAHGVAWSEDSGDGKTTGVYVNRGDRCYELGYLYDWGLAYNIYAIKSDGTQQNWGSPSHDKDGCISELTQLAGDTSWGQDVGWAR